MTEQMSDSRRRERTDWLMGRLEDLVIATERLGRHALDLGLTDLSETLDAQGAALDEHLARMVTGTAR